MKHTKKWIGIAAALFVFTACQKNNGGGSSNDNSNHVYSMTNSGKGNFLVDYRRADNGQLTYDSSYYTGGVGTGAGLGSQGSVIITSNGFILVVNAGSNSISSFKVANRGPVLQSTVNSGGTTPISITAYNDVVFVLNSGGAGNISGFNLSANGRLSAIANSTYPLSSANAGPAEIAFVNDGNSLVVTEKNNNRITSYTSNGTMHTLSSANTTPFGFAAGGNGNIYVSEAAGGAAGASTVSSYHINNNGAIKLVTGPVSANQTSACWVTLTGDGKYAFASNTASNTVSTFNINASSGNINVNSAVAATTGKSPADAALSNNSQYLYVLTPGSNTMNCYKVVSNGSLTSIQTITDIPTAGVGLAAK